jgi:hypothetical protein
MAQAQEGTESRLARVSVYVHMGVSDPDMRLPCAESIASAIFEKAGIHIAWKAGQPKPDPAELPVVIEISSDTPGTFHTGALAYAQPYEGEQVRIFWDRVKHTVSDRVVTKLLAHVMVHEITHNLEGIDYHSRTGIMKAHWTDSDLAELTFKSLSFDPKDVALIYAGLARRYRNRTLTKASLPVPARPLVFAISHRVFA